MSRSSSALSGPVALSAMQLLPCWLDTERSVIRASILNESAFCVRTASVNVWFGRAVGQALDGPHTRPAGLYYQDQGEGMAGGLPRLQFLWRAHGSKRPCRY